MTAEQGTHKVKGQGAAALSFGGQEKRGGVRCCRKAGTTMANTSHAHVVSGGTLLDRNVELLLSEPWGAVKAGVHYNKETLGSLCDQFARLEPQARRGALLGSIFSRQSQQKTLRAEIRSLVDLAVHDKDQWVSLIARALGGLKERFDLGQLQKDVPAVRSSTPRHDRVSVL